MKIISFKAIALGAPFTKLVCMGRAPMIPGYLGSNIEGVFKPEKRAELWGHWEDLPKNSLKILVTIRKRFSVHGNTLKVLSVLKKWIIFHLGAVAMCGWVDKLSCGLQQFMAGARKFNVSEIERSDIMAGNRETAEETGIPYMTEALDDAAKAILNS